MNEKMIKVLSSLGFKPKDRDNNTWIIRIPDRYTEELTFQTELVKDGWTGNYKVVVVEVPFDDENLIDMSEAMELSEFILLYL